MTVKHIIKSPDLWLAATVAVAVRVLLPSEIDIGFAKDFYGVAIGVLATIFAVFFAALTIVMSSTDDDFVNFLEEEGDYTRIIQSMQFTLATLFVALLSTLALYGWTSASQASKASTHPRFAFVGFILLFSYSLFASAYVAHDAIKYSEGRVRFLGIKKKRLPPIPKD